MPNEMESQSEYTGKEQNGSSQNNPQDQSKSIYRNIIDCHLYRFIDATVDNNLAALVKSGFPSPEELQEAKDNLIQEFAEAMGDGETKIYVELMKEVAILNAEYVFIQQSIPLLRLIDLPQITKGINEIINCNFLFDINDPVQYQKDLTRCSNRSKSILIKCQLKKMQLDTMSQKNAGVIKPTREYYRGLLISLSDEAKYEISDSIFVWDFIERIKRVNKKNGK